MIKKWVKIINHQFIKIALEINVKILIFSRNGFVIFSKNQKTNGTLINMFLSKLSQILFELTDIYKHTIKLINGKPLSNIESKDLFTKMLNYLCWI